MKLVDYTDPNSFASKMRKKRISLLSDLMKYVINKDHLVEVSICDIGGSVSYWSIFPFDEFSSTTFILDLVNLLYPDYDEKMSLPENVIISKKIGDACALSNFSDKQYDIAHSNSVIEHVGNISNIQLFASEVKRVARYHYVQTPNFWFPIEPHFILPFYAWLPKPARWKMLQIFKKKSFIESISADDSINLLTKREMTYLFPDDDMLIEKFFLLSKSIIMRSSFGK